MKTGLTTASGRLTLAAMAKEELIYTRISTALKNRLAIEANNRGEAESVIVREALNEYLGRRERGTLREEPAPYHSKPSSTGVRSRADRLAERIGADHNAQSAPLAVEPPQQPQKFRARKPPHRSNEFTVDHFEPREAECQFD
jgi:hypothetical protein